MTENARTLTASDVTAVADRLTNRAREVRRDAATADAATRTTILIQADTLTIAGQNLRDGVVLNLVTDFDAFLARCAQNFERLSDRWRTEVRSGAPSSTPARAEGLLRAYDEAVRTIREA